VTEPQKREIVVPPYFPCKQAILRVETRTEEDQKGQEGAEGTNRAQPARYTTVSTTLVSCDLKLETHRTHITQLMGRMVRTPLARRVESDERLNAVTCYLPHFDLKTAPQELPGTGVA
jgi:hypothetical protein